MGSLALVLDGLVQRRVELVALGTECRKTKPLKGGHQFVGNRLQRAGLQVAVAAGAVEIVEDTEQLRDDGRLGALGGELLVPQGALAVVGEVSLDPLQVGEQFVGLACLLGGFPRERPRRRPTGAGPVACSRTSPVTGSTRRLSVTVTGSCGSFELTCSPGHRPRRPRRRRRRRRSASRHRTAAPAACSAWVAS